MVLIIWLCVGVLVEIDICIDVFFFSFGSGELILNWIDLLNIATKTPLFTTTTSRMILVCWRLLFTSVDAGDRVAYAMLATTTQYAVDLRFGFVF
jgi:hypothetical protein